MYEKDYHNSCHCYCVFSSVAFADDPGENDPVRFETFGEAVATMDEGDTYTLSDEYAAALIRRNGRCFRVVAPLDEHAKELFAASFEGRDFPNDEYQALSEYVKTLPDSEKGTFLLFKPYDIVKAFKEYLRK